MSNFDPIIFEPIIDEQYLYEKLVQDMLGFNKPGDEHKEKHVTIIVKLYKNQQMVRRNIYDVISKDMVMTDKLVKSYEPPITVTKDNMYDFSNTVDTWFDKEGFHASWHWYIPMWNNSYEMRRDGSNVIDIKVDKDSFFVIEIYRESHNFVCRVPLVYITYDGEECDDIIGDYLYFGDNTYDQIFKDCQIYKTTCTYFDGMDKSIHKDGFDPKNMAEFFKLDDLGNTMCNWNPSTKIASVIDNTSLDRGINITMYYCPNPDKFDWKTYKLFSYTMCTDDPTVWLMNSEPDTRISNHYVFPAEDYNGYPINIEIKLDLGENNIIKKFEYSIDGEKILTMNLMEVEGVRIINIGNRPLDENVIYSYSRDGLAGSYADSRVTFSFIEDIRNIAEMTSYLYSTEMCNVRTLGWNLAQLDAALYRRDYNK